MSDKELGWAPIQSKHISGETGEFKEIENSPVHDWDRFDKFEWVKDDWEDEDEESLSP